MANKCPTCHSNNSDTLKFCGECGTQLPPPQDHPPVVTETLQAPVRELATGATFAGRYQIIEELGRGGMGRVYKTFDTKIKEKVALKLIKPEVASDKETIERFSNEIRLARRIGHRNVCKMFDISEAESVHFITMEYVHGEDLKSMIHMSGSLSLGMLLSVGKQVCDGLAEAHSLGVVHRDLKPQNIMIDKNGNAKIMDFGIARLVKDKGITGAGVMIGTPEYMSPEQAEAKEVDHRSDIYSLGVILYEMATSHVPFTGETALSIAMKHKGEIPKNPKQLNPHIPDDLSGVILKCLEKDKAKRYQSASDVRSELEKIEKGIPTTERFIPERKTITLREITVKLNPRRLAVPAVAIVIIIVAAVVILRLVTHKGLVLAPSGKPSLAVMYFENLTGDPALDHWRKALPNSLITDLSQSKYVNVLTGDELFDVLNKLGQLDAKSYSSKALKEIAARSGVNHILLGQLTKAGDSFRLSYTLKEYGLGEKVGSGWVAGEGIDGFFPMIDALTRKVKEDLRLTKSEIAGDVDLEIGRITTGSPEALLLYTKGREYHHMGDSATSIELMLKAVAIDPGFAMAYRSLAMEYPYLPAEAKKWLEKAMAVRDRVSERERLLLEAEYYGDSERTVPEAIAAYRKLLEIYPEDGFSNAKLAGLFRDYEMWDKAIEYGSKAVPNGDRTVFPYRVLAQAYEALGMPDKTKEAIELGIRSIGDQGFLRLDLADCYIHQQKFEEARQEIDRAIGLSPDIPLNHMSRGNLLLFQGDLAGAAEEFQKILMSKDPGARIYYAFEMAALAILQGKFKEALDLTVQAIKALERTGEKATASDFRMLSAYILIRLGQLQEALREFGRALKDAMEIDNWGLQRKALRGQGMVFALSNAEAEARQSAAELAALAKQSMNPNESAKVDFVLGSIELQKGSWGAAIEYLKKAADRLPHEYAIPNDEQAGCFEPLAYAYFSSGDLENAREEYLKITALTSGRLTFGDIYARSFYMLGRIAEQKGEKATALENYRKFLALWKDADPGIPEVEEARKRLAGLKGT